MPDGPEADEAIHRFLERIEASRLQDGKQLDLTDIDGAHHLRVRSRHGIVDIMRGGLPPLDYETVAADATSKTSNASTASSPKTRFPASTAEPDD